MNLVEILKKIFEMLQKLICKCDECYKELEEAEKIADEIYKMLEEWLNKIESGELARRKN